MNGKIISEKYIEKLKTYELPHGYIAVFFDEESEAQRSFLIQKKKTAEKLGIEMRLYSLEGMGNDEARVYIRNITHASHCKGAIIQLPLRNKNVLYLANTIPQEKDLDLLSARMYGDFCGGRSYILPPPVRVMQYILDEKKRSLSDFPSVAVIGQGRLIGKPISTWLLAQVPQVLSLDKGYNPGVLGSVDMVITATGEGYSLDPQHLKKDVWVIDFGYDKKDNSLVGDFNKEKSHEHVAFYTPTPSGTGPLLVTALFENIYVCNHKATYEDLF